MYRPEEYRSMSSISRPLRGDPRSLTVDGGERKRSESLPGPARTESESEPASESARALLKATDTAQGDTWISRSPKKNDGDTSVNHSIHER
jgi:hypothetical protein